MINAENLIFEGEYSYPLKKEKLVYDFNRFKDTLTNYLRAEGFQPQLGMFDIFGGNKFFTWKFHLSLGHDIDLPIYKIIKFLGNKNKIERYKFEKSLDSLRIDVPFIIEFQIRYVDNGLKIKAISKPCCYIRLGQGSLRSNSINEEKYSYIKNENIMMLENAMSAVGAQEVKHPQAKSVNVKFGLSDKLRTLKMNELADLSDKGYSRINNGRIEDGLSDLRTVFEKILVELIKITKNKPEGNVKSNLEKLKSLGYIDDKLLKLLDGTLRNFLYSYLSTIPTHHRERSHLLNEADANYVFSLFEDSLHYLLNKILSRT